MKWEKKRICSQDDLICSDPTCGSSDFHAMWMTKKFNTFDSFSNENCTLFMLTQTLNEHQTHSVNLITVVLV